MLSGLNLMLVAKNKKYWYSFSFYLLNNEKKKKNPSASNSQL